MNEENDEEENNDKVECNGVSVVIVAHNNAPELKEYLPLYLNQECNTNYEVIIVADEKDSETDDVIKLFASHKNLYATFMPLTSRYISRKKLAITLGIKAAHYEWVIVTDAWCRPNDEHWLKAMLEHCTEGNGFVMGYTNCEEEAPKSYHYDHLRTALYIFNAVTGVPYGTNCALVAMKKENFMAADGFLGNLKFIRGEYDFLVNKFAEEDATAITLDQRAFLTETAPIRKQWRNKHLFSISTSKSMNGAWRRSLLKNMDTALMHLCNICIIGAEVYGCITMDYIIISAGVIAFIMEWLLRCVIAKKALDVLAVPVNSFIIPYYDFTQWIRDAYWQIKYMFADKYDFITHKL